MAADKPIVDEPATRPKRGKRASRYTPPGIDLVRDAYIEAVSMSHQLNRPIVLEITLLGDKRMPIIRHRIPARRALAGARQRGAQRVVDLFRSPEMLAAQDFAALIGSSQATVNRQRKEGTIIALGWPKRGLRYPKWQLTDDGQMLPGLKEVGNELSGPWTVHRFLLQQHPELDSRTALDCLKAGLIVEVVEVARRVRRDNHS